MGDDKRDKHGITDGQRSRMSAAKPGVSSTGKPAVRPRSGGNLSKAQRSAQTRKTEGAGGRGWSLDNNTKGKPPRKSHMADDPVLDHQDFTIG